MVFPEIFTISVDIESVALAEILAILTGILSVSVGFLGIKL